MIFLLCVKSAFAKYLLNVVCIHEVLDGKYRSKNWVATTVAVAVPVDRGEDSSNYDEEGHLPRDLDRRRVLKTRGNFEGARRRRRRESNGRYLLEFQLE